jgi:hypothetical protein
LYFFIFFKLQVSTNTSFIISKQCEGLNCSQNCIVKEFPVRFNECLEISEKLFIKFKTGKIKIKEKEN